MSSSRVPGPGWPIARPGLRVGLLGGSFDPAHAGHVAITDEALRRFGLDRVWWLVSPGNPLKPAGPAALDRRVAEARRIMCRPRVEVTVLEARLGSRYTADTVARLSKLYRGVHFVWLMGSDNLATFHRWDRWRQIAALAPIGVLARPCHRLAALSSPAARILSPYRLADPRRLARADPPAWSFATIPLRAESSSRLRCIGAWKRGRDGASRP